MKPSEIESMPLQVEKLFSDLQNRVLEDIVRRIKKTGGITSTADYQIQKLSIFGNTTEFIESEIKRVLGATDAQMWELYDRAAREQYARDTALYEQINSNFLPYDENELMQSWVNAIVKQTNNEITNITQSLGFAVDMGGRKAFTPLSSYYQKSLDRACMDIVTGSFSYNTVLRRVVKELTDSGIRTVDYAGGYSNRATVAARRAVMTGVHQLTQQMNEKVASDLKTNTFEIEWHSGYRPEHWWGGLVMTKQQLIDVCRLGDVTGLCGANCYHSYFAFIPGVSVPTYTDEDLAKLNAREKEMHTWGGKEYNAYQAIQKQRQMEATMRAQRSRINLLKKGGADKEDIQAAQSRYQYSLHQYQGFSERMGLQPQMERVYMDGLGRVVNTRYYKKTNTGGEKRDIIKAQKRIPQFPASTISKKVEAGEYSLKLSKQQYDKHVFGTKKYLEYRQSREAKGGNPQSIITISEGQVQRILNEKCGSGIVRPDKSGNPTNVEYITCDQVIGQYFAKGEFHDTKKAAIHYSKRGAHLVPIRGGNYD